VLRSRGRKTAIDCLWQYSSIANKSAVLPAKRQIRRVIRFDWGVSKFCLHFWEFYGGVKCNQLSVETTFRPTMPASGLEAVWLFSKTWFYSWMYTQAPTLRAQLKPYPYYEDMQNAIETLAPTLRHPQLAKLALPPGPTGTPRLAQGSQLAGIGLSPE
jgi:hypothetical protein